MLFLKERICHGSKLFPFKVTPIFQKDRHPIKMVQKFCYVGIHLYVYVDRDRNLTIVKHAQLEKPKSGRTGQMLAKSSDMYNSTRSQLPNEKKAT